MSNHGLENRNYVTLPEGVVIELTPAGLVSRASAYLIDFAIRSVVMGIISFILIWFGDFGQGLILVSFFIISWCYNIFYESRGGQTPGKKRLKLRVVQNNGLPASFSKIVVRNLIRPVDMLPFGYCLGLVVMIFNREFKRIGDFAAETIVIYDTAQNAPLFLPKGDIEIPAVMFTTEEQIAILNFTERKNLSEARRAELANILSDVLKTDGKETEQKLMNYARYFAGHTNTSNDRHDDELKEGE